MKRDMTCIVCPLGCAMEVELDENLETRHKGLYVIGDGSGVTHSLSHASASGVYVADHIADNR